MKPEENTRKTGAALQAVELGIKQLNEGNMEGAEQNLRQALKVVPNNVMAIVALGMICVTRRRLGEAIQLFTKSIALSPNNPSSYCNLAIVEALNGNKKRAIECYLQAITIDPNDSRIHRNLGDIYASNEQSAEAISCYRKALSLNSVNAEAWMNLGNAIYRLGRTDEAIEAFGQALKIKPDAGTHSNLLMMMNYLNKYGPQDIFEAARLWAQTYMPESLRLPPAEVDKNPEKKLHIGYVSGDLKNHPIAYFLKNVLANRDKENFAVYLYNNTLVEDEYTKELRKLSDGERKIAALSDEEAVKIVQSDKIDILIDLSGHTADNRLSLFARKPAPLQASWMGYAGTTGLSQIDYYICDENLIYPGLEKFFVEKFMILPGSNATIEMPESLPIAPLPALEKGYVTFGCFNKLAKITPEAIGLWAKILSALPNSRLHLKSSAFSDKSIAQDYLKTFSDLGIASDRIHLDEKSPRMEYFMTYNEIDIALDTFPYNGGTTTIDTLWMGVPVISILGDTMVGRCGASILRNSGFPEWLAASQEEYVQKAMELAKDLPNLSRIRSNMREKLKHSPFFDSAKFTQNYQTKLRQIWQQYCEP